MHYLKQIYSKLNQDSRYENEPKHMLVLLRWLYLMQAVYYTVFLLYFEGISRRMAVWSAAFLALLVPCFLLTYRYRGRINVTVYVVLQTVWMVLNVAMLGWTPGIQNAMYALLILIFFAVYDGVSFKIATAAVLFVMRFALLGYCRVHAPVISLPQNVMQTVQIINFVDVFLEVAIACGSFGNSIESVEKKLILYNERLRKQASTDPLTGIWNRRSMLDYMQEYRDSHCTAPFVIAMGDIDFFKRVNDQWGHDCGDALLVWMTELFQKIMNGRGCICRWGGEEFLFHFPEMNGDQAFQVVSELLYGLSTAEFQWEGQKIHITMTFGMEENDFRSELTALIKQVDKKLYIGKEQGRNRIIY